MEPICKLKDIYKALYNFEKDFAKEHGITINEGMILCCLKDGEQRTANELCEFLGLSNSRVSKIILGVEDKGFITREMGKQDKRNMIFSLTESGKKKVTLMQTKKMDFKQLAIHFFELMGE